jgi:DNA-binding FrmR family transcriptional regulator|tara:strand:- start:205 stop:432 length:228 start_codon:yes stop_codon:yes gene_type:complete
MSPIKYLNTPKIMRNIELFRQKLSRIDGKLKTIKMMVTRKGTSVDDIHKVIDAIESECSDINTMIDRESANAYNR